MKNYFYELFKMKDLQIREEDLEPLVNQWEGIQSLKTKIPSMPSGDFHIAFRNIPGGDHIE